MPRLRELLRGWRGIGISQSRESRRRRHPRTRQIHRAQTSATGQTQRPGTRGDREVRPLAAQGGPERRGGSNGGEEVGAHHHPRVGGPGEKRRRRKLPRPALRGRRRYPGRTQRVHELPGGVGRGRGDRAEGTRV